MVYGYDFAHGGAEPSILVGAPVVMTSGYRLIEAIAAPAPMIILAVAGKS